MKKVMIFIDGSNFYKSTVENLGTSARIDFEKLIKLLVSYEQGRELIRTYYYNVSLDKNYDEDKYKSQQKFLSRLDYIHNFEVKLGRLEKRGSSWIEKGVDIKLGTDMLYFAYQNSFDIAILISGDGDYVSAIEKVKNLGKHVENAFFRIGKSYQLQKICDKFIELNEEFLEGCLLERK